MRNVLRAVLATAVVACLGVGTAHACTLDGDIVCEPDGRPVPGVVVVVKMGGEVVATATTDANGHYGEIFLPEETGTYTASLDFSGVGSGYVVSTSAPTTFTLGPDKTWAQIDWVVGGPVCEGGACWLTGGGAKFNSIIGLQVAEHGPRVSFGGNVNPGCSPTAGEGGQWNHLDHGAKLHFQGTAITVDQCGNVSGIPPGSTSPVTPYNFIEFHGTGRLTGIAGNKADYPSVCFEARAEDRNEPGSSGQRDGARVDRYFIRVTDCAGGTLLLLDDGTGAPITITDGNLQLHISSCP